MPRAPRLLFLLTDGGRARLVARSPENGHFVTLEEIDGTRALHALRQELKASPPARAISSTSPRRSAIGQEDYLRPAKEAFIGKVAQRAAELCHHQEMAGIVVAAPARLIGPLKAELEGRATVVGAVRKDLTKTPNSALGAWLNDAFTNPAFAR